MHSLHDATNDNGDRLINMAAAQELVVSSTRFPHRKIHLGTWQSPNRRTVNQIDHVLIDRRHSSNALDVRSYRGANLDSDHYLVIAKIRNRISMTRGTNEAKVVGSNIEALTTTVVSEDFAKTHQAMQDDLNRNT